MARRGKKRSLSQRIGRRIRWGLFWVLIAFSVGASVSWYYHTEIFRWLIAPAGGNLSPFEGGLPVFTAPADLFLSTFGIAIRGGLIVALPVFIVKLYGIFEPVIPQSRRRGIEIFLISIAVLFIGGAAFAYYVILPVGLRFLLHFGNDVAIPLITLREYLDLLFSMMFWIGIVFEIPPGMFLLTRLRILSYQRMKRLRKFMPFMAIILGTIITPGTDPINMGLVAAPIVLLYEVGLFLSWLARPEKGDYLWIRKISRAVRRVWHRIRAIVCFPVKVVRRIINRLLRGVRWVYRKIRRKQ